MEKSIVVAVIFLSACVADDDLFTDKNDANLIRCAVDVDDNICCGGSEDVCSKKRNRLYGNKIGEYLEYPALSNGSCTGGGSGAYQCATFAQGLWTKFNPLDDNGRPTPVFTKRWLVAARGLIVARATIDNGQNLFVFDNGSSEPPRETDLLIYQNIDGNGNLLTPSNAHPGHVSVVSQVVKINGLVARLGLIEENLVISGRNQELCDQNLSDSVMREVDVVFRNNGYFVDSGSSTLQVIGWIRHNLVGIYADEGWHEDDDDGVIDGHSTSHAFRSIYDRWDTAFVGWSRDNGGTPFVHTRNGHLLQDFVTSEGLGRSLVYNPNLGTALLVRDGFYAKYLEMASATGLPLDEEHPGVCLSVQNFENGYMCWSGWAVYWFSNGVLPPPRVEAEPPLDNSDSNGESDPESPPEEPDTEEANSPPECYENDWLPCYTGLISTQNIGLCQGGRTLCSNGHWQWNECLGEITPSPENCLDGLDNDCDGLSDCLDANCSGSAGCPSDTGGSEEFQATGEENEESVEEGSNQTNCDADSDGYLALSCGGHDCDDANVSIHPGALEICNYLDDDCDGWFDQWGMRNRCNTCGPLPVEVCGDDFDNDCDQRVDEGCPRDSDGDGYVVVEDCDDLDALQHPGAREVCNGEDDDCDELIDEDVCPSDSDSDGFLDSDDCAPVDPTVFPGAPESCNGRDDDCDGVIDENVRNRCNGCGSEPEERCADLIDNDCDGIVDELDNCPPDPDVDGDGVLDVSDNCPDTYNQGQADIDGDNIGDACDPSDDRVFPIEVCDGADNDQDGTADDGYECTLNSWADCFTECGSSGRRHCASNCVWSPCFLPEEICWNGIDDDCDGYESEDCGAIAGAWCYGASVPLSNSSFESSLNGWTLEVRGNAQAEMLQDCSTAQDGECSLRVVMGRGGYWEDITLSTELNLVSGNEYQIRLYTRKRDENIGEAPQILISSGDGVTNVGLWSQCSLSDGWNQCAIRFRARDSVSGYRLLLLLGRISGEVLLDDVRVLGCS